MSADPNKDYLVEGVAPADEVIDAGEVISIAPEKIVAFDAKKHRAETSRVLALLAMAVMGGLIVIQYVATIILSLYGQDAIALKLTELFQSLLPVTSGLTVSAYTYYFTRER